MGESTGRNPRSKFTIVCAHSCRGPERSQLSGSKPAMYGAVPSHVEWQEKICSPGKSFLPRRSCTSCAEKDHACARSPCKSKGARNFQLVNLRMARALSQEIGSADLSDAGATHEYFESQNDCIRRVAARGKTKRVRG